MSVSRPRGRNDRRLSIGRVSDNSTGRCASRCIQGRHLYGIPNPSWFRNYQQCMLSDGSSFNPPKASVPSQGNPLFVKSISNNVVLSGRCGPSTMIRRDFTIPGISTRPVTTAKRRLANFSASVPTRPNGLTSILVRVEESARDFTSPSEACSSPLLACFGHSA